MQDRYFANTVVRDLLIHRIFHDTPPHRPADIAYIFAIPKDSQSSGFKTAKQLWETKAADLVGICATEDTKHGYPGGPAWRTDLISMGLPEEVIVPVELSTGPGAAANTLAEAEGLVRLAKDTGFGVIYITTANFHLLRAAITTISVVLREHPNLKVYFAPGAHLAWQEKVLHSQGVVIGTRWDLVSTELQSINKYCEKGDLKPAAHILRYLNKRDII